MFHAALGGNDVVILFHSRWFWLKTCQNQQVFRVGKLKNIGIIRSIQENTIHEIGNI